MTTFSETDTLILWTKNTELKNIVNLIAKELKVKVFEPEHVVDLIAVPCFIKIIDAEYLRAMILELGNEVEEYFTYENCAILVYGDLKTNIPNYIQDKIVECPYVFSKKILLKIIKSNYDLALLETQLRKKQFKSRAFRSVYIYSLLQKEPYLNISKIASLTMVSDRTIRRDLETLAILFPNLSVSVISQDIIKSMNFDKFLLKKVVLPKELELHKKIKRTISLLMEEDDQINTLVLSEIYGVSEKTINRDLSTIKALKSIR